MVRSLVSVQPIRARRPLRSLGPDSFAGVRNGTTDSESSRQRRVSPLSLFVLNPKHRLRLGAWMRRACPVCLCPSTRSTRSGTVRRCPSARCVAIRATICAWSRCECVDVVVTVVAGISIATGLTQTGRLLRWYVARKRGRWVGGWDVPVGGVRRAPRVFKIGSG